MKARSIYERIDLFLEPRISHLLNRNGIFTINDLMQEEKKGSIYQIPFLGQKTQKEIKLFLIECEKNQISHSKLPGKYSFSDNSKYYFDTNFRKNCVNKNLLRDLDYYSEISISKLDLPQKVVDLLYRYGISTLKDIIIVDRDRGLLNFDQISEKLLGKIKFALNKWDQNDIFNHQSLESPKEIIKKQNPKDEFNNHDLEPLTTIINNWSDLIYPYLERLDNRQRYILIYRFGSSIKRLEELAKYCFVTRERIRQIQFKIENNIVSYIFHSNSKYLIQAIYQSISELGENLSQDSLEERLVSTGLLGKFPEPLIGLDNIEISEFESLLCWITIASNWKLSKTRFSELCIQDFNLNYFRKAKGNTYGNIVAVKYIDPSKKKELIRKIYNTGGINIDDVKKIFNVRENIARAILQSVNAYEVIPKWFTLLNVRKTLNRIPLLNSGCKMLSIVPKMEIDDFIEGLRKHSQRYYDSIAPKEVVITFLRSLGFTINDGLVNIEEPIYIFLSNSEECFKKTISLHNEIASIYEIVEGFLSDGFSIPAVSAVLSKSPIVEKIDPGFYKLRGIKISWDQISEAKKRQIRYSQNEQISHGLDGIIRLRVTITNYSFMSGVLYASKSETRNLAGEWKYQSDDGVGSSLKLDGFYFWGFSRIFKNMNIKVGERIEIGFNTWNRSLTIIRCENE